MSFNYPNFEPKLGNLTELIKREYITEKIKTKAMTEDALHDKQINSLIASNDINKKIFFWQLYSIIGEDSIHILIKNFYERIFKDSSAPWFRDEFLDLGSLEYHIRGQKKFWLDVMGGGPHYWGGLKKLNIRHKLVKNIMTIAGAQRWMMHMRASLLEVKLIFEHDKRIIPCINDFLIFFMKKYSVEFDFNIFEVPSLSLSRI